MTDKDNKKIFVHKANILYHTELAEDYDQIQPHFRPENVIQVRAQIERFAQLSGKRLLDIGCGTGFVLSLAHSCFDKVYGVDITPAMLSKANSKFKGQKVENIELLQASSDKLPFSDSYFDVVTAYSFLHHLPTLLPTFSEVYRVLKDGGIFCAIHDPNYYFWELMKSLPSDGNGISELLETERKSVCNIVEEVQTVPGSDLNTDVIKMAEYLKTQGGFKEEDIKELLHKVGFEEIHYEYMWYWQQGKVIRDLSLDDALYFENHLRSMLPLTRGFFKYVRMEVIK